MRIAKNGFFQAAVPLTFLATSFSVWADNLTAHKDNYFLPYYQESRVNQARFEALNPNQTSVNDTFVQFQFSAKYRVLSFENDGLYIAYTQRSNWEAYASSAYFRDSTYNPEMFYRFFLEEDWQVDVGGEHASNGAGGENEVSWNRIYVDVRRNFDWGFVRFKPWARVGNVRYNPDITDFLGYAQAEIGWWPTENQEVKLLVSNLFSNSVTHNYYGISWNVPIYQSLRGYIKAETGYGLTISNYNFDESAVGVGAAFSF